jgi:hypothetical protein
MRKVYWFWSANEAVSAETRSKALIMEEMAWKEKRSSINPQKKRPRPLNMDPQLPMTVRKESLAS